jgi:beta-carotene 3-hydroxylase
VSAPAIALVSFVLMEPLTALTHRFVMHGLGRALHRSHHRRKPAGSAVAWEANDWFPVMFAAIVMVGFGVGFNVDGWSALVPVGIGVTAYGVAYALVHDGYIHRRLPLFGDRTIALLEPLAEAHRRHHARNAAPYGMLAPVRLSSRPAKGSRPSHEPLEA